jgi:hypothetical protein
MKYEHGAWCKNADRWNSMYSEKICPSATLMNSNPNDLDTREILRCAKSRLSQWTTQGFTKVNIYYLNIM